MSYLQPPHLEMNFYFANMIDEGFVSVLRALIELGAEFDGTIASLHGEDIKLQTFSGRYTNSKSVQVDIDNIDDFLADDTIRFVHAKMNKAIGLVERGEILTYGTISKEASHTDHPPVQIITSGEVFSINPEFKNQSQYAGKKLYRRFIQIIDRVRPSYAAITSENDMECPTDLKRISLSMAFSEFYVDSDYLGQPNIERIKSAYSNAYIEHVANGIYISCWHSNPKGKVFEKDWSRNDAQSLVVSLIAARATS